jgi:predicted ATP-grasp superfamily ATP-dependent carboligase
LALTLNALASIVGEAPQIARATVSAGEDRRGAPPSGRRPLRTFDAVVTDVHSRSALAGMRDLGRAGLDVLALGPQRSAAGTWSSYAAGWALAPDSVEEPAAFVRRIAELAGDEGPFVLYPSGEPAIDALVQFGHELPASVTLPYADLGTLEVLRDKRALAGLAARAGLTTPATVMEATAAEVAASPPPIPCAVKQVLPDGALKNRTQIVLTPAQLHELLDSLPPDEPLLIQERAEGALTGLAVVIDREGRLVARFQQVSRRLWPVHAGGSTLAVSVEPDEELTARAARMLADAGFWGLAQLQFLPTPRGPGLIDVNPRFYGSMPMATASGVNLPAAWHAVATGERTPVVGPYRVGVGYRWLEGDLTAAFNGLPGRLVTRTPRPKSGAIWASDDPLPSMILAAEAVRVRLRRRLTGAPAV